MEAARAQAACDDLASYADLITRFTPTPGGVVVVADARGVMAESSFGHADLERQTPMRGDHAFEIGSISKVFVGLLTNQLIDEGLTTLETPVQDVLPWIRLGDHTADITLRHLLHHSAGLVAGIDALTDDTDQAWAVRDLATTEPGRCFHYSNVGYVILGLAASALTDRQLPVLLTQRLLEPMGMLASMPAVRHDDRPRLAVGYQPAADDRPWVPGMPLAPAPWFEVAAADGNIAAPAKDLARLVMLLLGDGQVAGRQVLSSRGLARMIGTLSPGGEPVVVPPGCPEVASSRYGLGVNVEAIDGHRCLSHGGGMVGYSTFVLVDLTAGFGAAVLTNANGDGLTAQRLTRWVHARLVGGESAAGTPFPVRDPLVRGQAGEPSPVPIGRFTRARGEADALEVTLDPADQRIQIRLDDAVAPLYRADGHFVTDHPRLRRFHLDPEDLDGLTCWVHGPDVWRPDGDTEPGAAPGLHEEEVPESWRSAVGHYRSYSPWYPHLRIYERGGRLWLATPGGVEAPSDPEELVPLGSDEFRIGADPGLPERLRLGPVIDGHAVHVVRDGCRYSRTFTD